MHAAAAIFVWLQFFMNNVLFFSVGILICVRLYLFIYFVLCTCTVHRSSSCVYKNAAVVAQQNPGIPVGRG